MNRRLLFLALALLGAGCGQRRSDAEIARGKQAVTAALDSWKNNEPPAKLKSLTDPVEFSEELRGTHTLTEYALGPIDSSDKEVIRFRVTLKLRDKKGKVAEREAVYAVALKTPIVVARDPYY